MTTTTQPPAPVSEERPGLIEAKPVRHPWRWVAIAVLAVLEADEAEPTPRARAIGGVLEHAAVELEPAHLAVEESRCRFVRFWACFCGFLLLSLGRHRAYWAKFDAFYYS